MSRPGHDPAVRVLYDGALLALLERPNPPKASGLHRVADRLARELAASPECELRLCVSGSALDAPRAARYLDRQGGLSPAALSYPGWYMYLAGQVDRRVASAGAAGARPALRRATRALWETSSRVLTRLSPPVSARLLDAADVYHSPYFAIPGQVRQRGVARFITVHDIIPLLHTEWFGPPGEHYLARIIRSIHPGDWVLTPSEATRADLCAYRPDLDPARVLVIPWAADPSVFHPVDDPDAIAAVRRRYAIPEGRFLLALGNPSGRSLEPRKNVERIVGAFVQIARQPGLEDVSLVVAGNAAWRGDPTFRLLNDHPDVARRVLTTGYIAEHDLAGVYSAATAFLYPSLYEGFGLPPLEAMQCGTPVIGSNTSSLPEVIGDAGFLVDPMDVDAISAAVTTLLLNDAERLRMRETALSRAARFSWAETARMTLAAYRVAMRAGG